MIVRPSNRGVIHLNTPPDHAALARRIMQHWQPLAEEKRRDSILRAVEHHDWGWGQPDAGPDIDDEGRIQDFVNVAIEVRQEVWPRCVAHLETDDPWAAALVANHAVTVYGRFRDDPDWTDFFTDLSAHRDRLVRQARRKHEDMLADYQYVRLGDLISLAFCTTTMDDLQYEHWHVRVKDDRVVVTPSALDVPELAFEVRAVELPDRPFESARELREAIASAPRKVLAGEVAGQA
jgi:hypothetical protein